MQHMQQFIIATVGVLMAISSAPLYGQSAETPSSEIPRITLGAQGALSAATLVGVEGNEFGDWSWRFSVENARVYGTLPLTPKLGLQPSVAYVGKGAAQHFEGGASYQVKLDYIELSVLGVVSNTTLGRGKSSVYALAGPTLGFKSRCTAEVTEWEDESTSGITGAILEAIVGEPVDCGEAFQGRDLGITAGVGFEWVPKDSATEGIRALDELKASLEILYTQGLQSIASDDSGDGSSVVEGDPKNRTLSVWLGIALPLYWLSG